MTGKIILAHTNSSLAGRELELTQPGRYVLGRSGACDIQLPNTLEFLDISRQHCVLDVGPPLVRVRDLGSRNGTFLNGENIGTGAGSPEAQTVSLAAPRPLVEGDELRVGHHVFRVEGVHAVAPPTEEVVSEKGQWACALGG